MNVTIDLSDYVLVRPRNGLSGWHRDEHEVLVASGRIGTAKVVARALAVRWGVPFSVVDPVTREMLYDSELS